MCFIFLKICKIITYPFRCCMKNEDREYVEVFSDDVMLVSYDPELDFY